MADAMAHRDRCAPYAGSLRSLIGPPVCSGRAAGRTSTPAAPHAHRRAALAAHGRRRARPAPPRHRRRADRRRDHVRAGRRPVQRVRPDGATGAGRPRAGGDHPVRLRDPVVRVAVRPAGALDAAPVAPRPRHRPARLPRRGGRRPTGSTPRNVLVLGLLAAASMSSAFINTLFTQTVKFAADDFGVGDSGRRRRRLAGARRHRAGVARRRPRRPPRAAHDRRRRGGGGPAGDRRRRARPDVPVPRRHPGGRPPARPGARLPGRRGRRRGDAAQQPGLRRQRAGDGQRARRRRRGHGAAARRPRRPARGASSTSSP